MSRITERFFNWLHCWACGSEFPRGAWVNNTCPTCGCVGKEEQPSKMVCVDVDPVGRTVEYEALKILGLIQ